MARRQCGFAWDAPGHDTGDTHTCTRPPGHPDHHACCAARPAPDGQEPLFVLPWRLAPAGLAAACRREGDE